MERLLRQQNDLLKFGEDLLRDAGAKMRAAGADAFAQAWDNAVGFVLPEEAEDREEGGGAFDDVDKVLTARLFEAQRKAHQCTFRGVMAQGRSLLEEEEDDE